MGRQYVVGRASDLPDGGVMVIAIGSREYAVFNVRNRFYGIVNRCPHRGAPLAQGRLGADITSDRPGSYSYDEAQLYLMCPWHGWEFDVATGQSYLEPGRVKNKPLPVACWPGDVLLEEIRAGNVSMDPGEYATFLQEDIDVRSDDGIQRVPGPYRVDTVDIRVEDDFLILEFGSSNRSGDSGADDQTAQEE